MVGQIAALAGWPVNVNGDIICSSYSFFDLFLFCRYTYRALPASGWISYGCSFSLFQGWEVVLHLNIDRLNN